MSSGLVLECTATVGASDVAGTIDVVSLKTDPTVSAVTELQVPLTENWIATDMYILASADSGTSNPVVTMDKNRGRTLVQTPPLSSVLITNNTRPRFSPQPVGFEGGSIVRMFTHTTINNNATADSIKFFVAISIV
jgi:hypothetical protein